MDARYTPGDELNMLVAKAAGYTIVSHTIVLEQDVVYQDDLGYYFDDWNEPFERLSYKALCVKRGTHTIYSLLDPTGMDIDNRFAQACVRDPAALANVACSEDAAWSRLCPRFSTSVDHALKLFHTRYAMGYLKLSLGANCAAQFIPQDAPREHELGLRVQTFADTPAHAISEAFLNYMAEMVKRGN